MRSSLESLRAWLAEKPRTLGWNAIVAYDRGKTNEVLLQEYIGRFSTDSYFPPMELLVPVTENEVQCIFGYTVDAPRLSFENSDIASSRARLTMTVMGGSQIEIRHEPGAPAPQVTRVSSYNALIGPRYTADIDLRVAAGSVDSAGRVELDLGAGENPQLSFGPAAIQRSKGGQYFRYRLSRLEPEIRVFVLNEMKNQAGQFLQPQQFVLRTHAEPGARVARAANYGEGAVLLFVTMKGESNGTVPVRDTDMQFLIPAGAHSATVLLGHRFLVERLLVGGVSRMDFARPPECFVEGPANGFVERIRVQNPVAGFTRWNMTAESWQVDIPPFLFPYDLFDIAILRGAQENGNLNLEIDVRHSAPSEARDMLSGLKYPRNLTVNYTDDGFFRFSIDSEGRLTLPYIPRFRFTSQFDSSMPDAFLDVWIKYFYWPFDDHFMNGMLAKTNGFARAFDEVDVFRLNSLLFRGDNAVRFTGVEFPGDLLILGQLAPSLTHFTISPLEPRVGQSGTVQFRTEPEVPGVSWRLDNIPGGSGAPGSIDASGRYTAPAKGQIEGFFKRVRVTASKGGHSSSALVTVLSSAIHVDPMVQICAASSGGREQTCELTAGSLVDPLVWSVMGNSGARITRSTIEGGDHTFVAGPASSTNHFSMEEVRVSGPFDLAESAWIVVIHKAPNATITGEALGQDRIQLLIDLGSGPLTPAQAIEAKVEWTLLKGGGALGPTGIYQADPASPYRFAVIVGFVPPPAQSPYPPYTGYMILPVPLIELSALTTTFERSNAYFKALPGMGEEQAAKILSSEV